MHWPKGFNSVSLTPTVKQTACTSLLIRLLLKCKGNIFAAAANLLQPLLSIYLMMSNCFVDVNGRTDVDDTTEHDNVLLRLTARPTFPSAPGSPRAPSSP